MINQLNIEDSIFNISIYYIYNIKNIKRNSNLIVKKFWLFEYILNIYIIKISNSNINFIKLKNYNLDFILNILKKERIQLE